VTVTIAPMVDARVWEPPYFLRVLDNLRGLNDDIHFIIARTNTPQEVDQFRGCIKHGKKNILILLSDEAGIHPPFIDKLHLVFRTYSNKMLYDNEKIFPIPCGYCYGHNGALYEEGHPKRLIEREYDLFYSGQRARNRSVFIREALKVKDKFKSIINETGGFSQGYNLGEYYSLMRNSKIAFVPNGAVVPESFRYFEAFEAGCIVVTSFPRGSKYNNWFYEDSPATFLSDWGELTEGLIRGLLTDESLMEYEIRNKEYFDKNISPSGVANYMLNIIKS